MSTHLNVPNNFQTQLIDELVTILDWDGLRILAGKLLGVGPLQKPRGREPMPKLSAVSQLGAERAEAES